MMHFVVGLVHVFAGITVLAGCLQGLWALRSGVDPARAVLARTLLAALNFLMAATLLRAMSLSSWMDLASFATILATRVVIKAALMVEVPAVQS